MEAIDSSPASPNSKKRAAPHDDSPEKKPLNLKGTQFVMPTPPDTDQSSNASPTCTNNDAARQASPAPSSSALSSVELVSSNELHNTSTTPGLASTTAPSGSDPRPAKRRKLTVAEKDQQKKEKEAKDAEKAEQKAKREEEKRTKDEEKRKKAEEREAKKREKDLEEERKAQEKLKKERAQMRLGAFFQKPATPVKQSEDGEGQVTNTRRKSLSLEPFDAVANQIRPSASPCRAGPQLVSEEQTPAKQAVSDYQKFFLPFQLRTHSSMAPLLGLEDMQLAQEAFDHDINDPSLREKYDLGIVDSYASLERQFASEREFARGLPLPDTHHLIDQIQGSSQQPIDLTNDKPTTNPMSALQHISRRYIEFSRDVRPAYYGTYTKIRSPRTTRKLRRNPFSRSRRDTDYDYDSEAEWEEPEEGEDILDDEEDETDSVGEVNEMDGFLDDEEDALKNKRKLVTGDMVPNSTGLCWENEFGKITPSIEGGSPSQVMRGMRIGVLLPGFMGTTIDPFSTEYWQTEQTPALQSKPVAEQMPTSTTGLMAPPRPPLQPRTSNNSPPDTTLVGAAEGMRGPINSVAATQGSKPGRKAAPKILSKEDLDEFKDAVVGSQLFKAELLKGLKARFPKLTNDTIKSTLGEHFAYVGANKVDKKWVYVATS
ncbi:hypothetical protein LTR37_011970 [Vermiconidia calcicola]|uniref:Uncharacterized protein n=1 Tax=Vermiconidia calcicola TaxID=1690605 RepID=A0ACC3N393_9PEZI|nr:hypothetical protein LTR37_011970 [Vermiconidia calcicola]